MKIAKRLFLFSFAIALTNTVFTQAIERRFVNFSLEDGLSQSTILDIKQDQFGYTWLATADGLNVFNGADFEVYKKNPADTNSLSDNFIYAILPFKDGKVWAIAQDRVINEIDHLAKTVKRIAPVKGIPEAMYAAKQMLEDAEGNIWISAAEEGIIILNRAGKVVKKMTEENGLLPGNVVNSLVIDSKYIWIGTNNGLCRMDKNLGNSKVYFPDRHIGAVLPFKNKIFISFFDELITVAADQTNPERMLEVVLKGETITCLAAQKSETIWLGSASNGVYEYQKGSINHYTQNQSDKWSVIDDNIFSIYSDNSDNIWIGTNSGLSVYKTSYNPFKLIRANANKNSLQSNKIYDIYEDQTGKIWFINYDGNLDVLENGVFSNLTASPSLNGNRLRSIFQDSSGQFYCGTMDNGVYLFFPKTNTFSSIKATENLDFIRKIALYEGTLLIAHGSGIAQYNLNTMAFTRNILNKTLQGYDLLIEKNTLYIATFAQGLFKMNLIKKSYINYKYKTNTNSISSDNVMAIVPIGDDTLALGTYGGGINLFSKSSGTFTSFSEMDGLKNNSVYGIISDQFNNLWVSTNAGLSKWFANRKTIKNYDLPIQLQSLEFNEDAFLKTKGGVFYFGGVNGVNFFRPEEILPNTIPPKAIITRILVGNQTINLSNIVGQILALKAKENDLQIFFSAIKLSVPEKTTFLYKLEGLETEWRSLNKEKYVRFNNLPAGSYTFLIKACNEDGICDITPQSFAFNIATPFYKSIWFLLLLGLFVVSLGYAFYTIRTNNMRKEYAAKMTNAELRALRIQMNPHFIFNSLNSIQYYVLNADAKTAYKYLTKFSALMRRTLQHSKENFLPLKEEIESVKIYLELENMRLENSLEVVIDVDKEVDREKTLLPTLFIQPLAENAILHGLIAKEGIKKITIRFKKTAKGIQCIIEDNGIGRQAAAELNKQRSRSHQSTALSAIEARIKILNDSANFKISMQTVDLTENNKPSGTRVILNIG